MLRAILISFMAIALLTGCAEQTGKKDFDRVISSFEQLLSDEQLVPLLEQAHEIKSTYDKYEWVVNLLGDEGEYERLNESINRLIASVEAGELSDTKIELATLKTVIQDIYSL